MSLISAIELFEKPGLGRVDKAIAPEHRGRVFFEGTYWPAKLYSADTLIAEVESAVAVLGRQGLTLLVRPFVTNPVG